MHRLVLDSGRALFYQFLNLITMNISKIKSFVFGLAFLGTMGFGWISLNAQTLGGPGSGEDQCKVEILFAASGLGRLGKYAILMGME